MSEQSWRNPRPAPRLRDVQPRLGPLLIPVWLWAWWPAVVWACVIFTLSTDTFSMEHTGWVLRPIFQWLFPHLDEDTFDFIHIFIRKSAHFVEYFVLGLLVYRGVRGAGKGWRWTWALIALFIAAGYSALDEIHQAFTTSRTASPYDSLLDSAGAFVAIGVLFLWFRWRKPTPQPVPDTL